MISADPAPDHLATAFCDRLADRSARVGVIGLGYVGLPLVRATTDARFRVTGFDIDPGKVAQLSRGRSYIRHIPDAAIRPLLDSGRFQATSDFARVREQDVVVICVPILVTENLSKGARYTEIKLTFSGSELEYATARWHRPWNIGVTPNADITAMIAELKADLIPILGVEIGRSTVPIPRADPCGNVEGRTCESLEGNLTTDAMREATGAGFAVTPAPGPLA